MSPQTDATRFLGSAGRRFADPFLSADPTGSRVVSLTDLQAALPGRQAMFAAAGVGPLALVEADEQWLDDSYLLVRTTWTAAVTRPVGDIEIHATYLLRRLDPDFEILLYLNHEHIADVLGQRRPHSLPTSGT